MARERHDAAFIVGAILGGVAGAAVMLAQAPQSGAQTRSQLAEQASIAAQRLNEVSNRAFVQAQGWAARASASIGALRERTGVAEPAPADISADDTDEVVLVLERPEPPLATVTAPTAGESDTDPAGAGGEEPRDIVLSGPRPAADQPGEFANPPGADAEPKPHENTSATRG